MLFRSQVPLLRNLYGRDILPDSFSAGSNLSYRALGKYMIIAKNYKSDFKAPGLKYIGVVTSENDTSIDMNLATNIPKQMATASNAKFQHSTIPASTSSMIRTPCPSRFAPCDTALLMDCTPSASPV